MINYGGKIMHNNRKEQIFWGLALIAIAILAVVGGMGYLGGLSVWTILLTVMFVIVLIRSIYPLNFAGILFSLAFIGIIYDKQLGIESLTPWTLLLVALLGSIGLTMIFGSHHGRRRNCYGHNESVNGNAGEAAEEGKYNENSFHNHGSESGMDNSEVIDRPDDSHVFQSTQFGGTTKYVNSDNFVEADLECKFGGLAVYFNNAHIKARNASVHIYASFAGVELYFPKEWTVVDNIRCSIGGVSYENEAMPSGDVVITLDGEVSVGGVTIKYI